MRWVCNQVLSPSGEFWDIVDLTKDAGTVSESMMAVNNFASLFILTVDATQTSMAGALVAAILRD